MNKARKIAIGLMALGAWLAPAQAAQAAPGPAWQLSLVALPTHLASGSTGTVSSAPIYGLIATNVGAGDATGPVTLKATLPIGVTPIFTASAPDGGDSDTSTPDPVCSEVASQTVTCTAAGPVHPSRNVSIRIPVTVTGSPGVLPDATASVESPGATTVTASAPTVISATPPPFGFLDGLGGFSTLFTQEDGQASQTAGTHPDQLTVDVGFPVEQPGGSGLTTGAGHPRDVVTDLPQGVVINPNATEKLCTEVELLSGEGTDPGCPAESQIGMVTAVTELSGPRAVVSALYNMVPAPGSAAAVAFNAAGVGIYVHLNGGVRSESDFGLYAVSRDTLARGANPLEHVQVQLWGSPSGESHDQIRDECRAVPTNSCPVNRLDTPMITLPSACSDELVSKAHARSWEEAEAGVVEPEKHAEAQARSTSGAVTPITGCAQLDFDPTLTLKPDTAAAESPTGAEITLRVPQSEGDDRATSTLKDTVVTFPDGLVANAAAAGGQEGCGPSQIGMLTGVGESPVHLSDDRPQCPNASKLGTLEVSTPLLDHTLPGSVYLADPYDNPFGTLLASYLVIDSPRDGIVAKLASKIEVGEDGQLTASVEEAPQLPIEEVKINLFGGPRAALRTPITCGPHTTASVLTPWSGNPAVTESDSFQISGGPNGRPCVSDESQMPNDPDFSAGTATPLAGAYSPFLARLSREEGEQQLKSFNMTLPGGLTGKLAGVGICSAAAIAAAEAKTGKEELASPSCPADSLIGKVDVGAGAGPTPYYTSGKIYMAGPFRGAPLSAVAITPALAGPFDLGVVAVRVPAYVDPVTAVLTVRNGEEFPHILEGIPLELRDARISLDRDRFTLNPTSCSEKAISGEAISLLGSSAPLFERFQVGGCKALDYAPRLSIRLFGKTKRGGHPRLRAILTAKPGEEANTKRASVALPRSEFIENAHFQTVCTRVQFAADECPAGSIYGHARAITPLLDEPIEGPVYLRSSSNELPDMVAALKGPPSRPIEVELAGRIDSVNGGIRTTFDLVPDQPVSKFILNMRGGKKSLIVNSRDICKHTYRATAKFDAQNGKFHDFRPKLKASCKGKRGQAKGKGRRK